MWAYQQDNARGRMARTQLFDLLVISTSSTTGNRAIIRTNHNSFPCLVGNGGIGRKSREGDGITPSGRWGLKYFLYRSDKIQKPFSILPGFPIKRQDSWCDLPDSKSYNRPLAVTLPQSDEALWRSDCLYDIVIVLDHNTQPAISGQGSAIFIHLIGMHKKHTHGCIAIQQSDLLKILSQCGPQTKLLIQS